MVNKRKYKNSKNKYDNGGSIDFNKVNAVAGGIGTIVEASMANAEVDTTQADNAIEAVKAFQPSTTSLNALNAGFTAAGSADTSHDYKDYTVSTGEGLANMGKAGLAGFTSGLQTGGIWGGIVGLLGGLGASGGAWAAGTARAKREAQRLNREAALANEEKYNKAEAARDTYFANTYDDARINHVAYGGPLFNHSGDWSNGITFINEGGTHEENPLEGVQVGVDQEGIPNLVEEGEIIYNDYVFSNRLKPTKKQLKDYGFKDKYIDWSFSKIVEDLQKVSAETPLDKISKESLDDMMTTMINMQEEVRMKKGLKGQNRLMASGGTIFDTYDPDYVTDRKNYLGKKNFSVSEVNKVKIAIAPKIGIGPKINNTASGKDSIKKHTNKIKDKTTNNINERTPFNWSSIGTGLPIISNAIKTIYNAAMPVDYANVLAEQAYREIPTMSLPRIGGKQVYKGIDKNRFTNPIINQGRATARDIQNNALTAGQALVNLANANYNTQGAIGEAYANADQQDLANRLQVAQFNLGIDQANANLSQAEQAANIQRANRIAAARVQDAAMREQLQQLKGQAIDETSTATVQGIADLARQNIEWDMIKNNPELAKAIAIMSKVYSSKYGGMLTKRRGRK